MRETAAVFEAARWRVHNRRIFAVLERLYEQAGTWIRNDGWDLTDDAEFAAAIAHNVGLRLLAGSIDAAASDIDVGRRWRAHRVSSRKRSSAWKTVTPENGARASIFLSLAAAAMLSDEFVDDIDPAPVEHARLLVDGVYSPPEDDVQAIEAVKERVIEKRSAPETAEATARGGTRALSILQVGEATLSFQALAIAGAEPQTMPAYKSVAHLDQSLWDDIASFDWFMASSFVFEPSWRFAKERFLEIAFA